MFVIVSNNVLFIHVFTNESGEYRKFMIYADRIVLPNGDTIGIDKLRSIHEIIGRYWRICEHRRIDEKTRLLEHNVLLGRLF
jgi:hypothetical protein